MAYEDKVQSDPYQFNKAIGSFLPLDANSVADDCAGSKVKDYYSNKSNINLYFRTLCI